MRILVILRSAWRNDNNTGNTMTNFFSESDDEIFSISLRDQIPQNDIALENLAISEIQILKGIFRGEKTGVITKLEEYEKIDGNTVNINAEKKVYNIAKKLQSYLLYFLREGIWRSNKWKTGELDEYIERIKPDVIFMQTFNCVYPYKVLEYVKSKTRADVILLNADDNYTLRQVSVNPVYWLYRFYLRRYIKRAVESARVSYVISGVQKAEYEKLFNREFKILTKFDDFDEEPVLKSEYNSPLQLVFTGNLSSNRWKVLGKTAKALEKLNRQGVKAQLRIYSATALNKRMKKQLEIPNTSFFMGYVPAQEIAKVQSQADVLVHAEATDIKNRVIVHQSFSTKLVDYMKRARPILAVGHKRAASIVHLKENDAGIVVTDEKKIYEAVREIVENPALLDEYSKKGYECGRKFHNKAVLKKMLVDDIHK